MCTTCKSPKKRRTIGWTEVDPTQGTEPAVESGPYVADADGVYTRAQGSERWWLVGACIGGLIAIALLPWSLEERLRTSMALIAGCAIGSLLGLYWRRRRPLPLVLLREGTLMCFAPGIAPRLLARFPAAAVSSVALSAADGGVQLEWLFRGGEQGRFTLGNDARLGLPLAHFLSFHFGDRFKDRRA